ncbi:1310_t:CDS:2 [Ambispora leptoticha]|uniref:1310_t:CDS:1 n=1 Tax=Ambispora leptoticha TaxID=144679 RepID=A0A9N9CHP0_9GLOM|nr:1310_t:CDS:2 [Ambispora leptoticha]
MSTIPQKIAKAAIKSVIGSTLGGDNNSDASQATPTNSQPINAQAPNNTSASNAVKKRKNKYNLPPGLTKQEAKPILGILPVIGDFAGVFLALTLVNTARQLDLPPAIVSRMMINVMIDFLIGLVPFIGDVADFLYKCNTRNANLLHEYLEDRAKNRSLVLEEGSVEVLERVPPVSEEGTSYNGRIGR